jgi:predicted SnoaL-like aldol condensation-catalyzing enzyme
VDIFRLDRRGRIVEHWDVLAAISPISLNGNPEV